MTASRWARIVLTPRAQAVLTAMDEEHRARFWRIVAVITNAPGDGAFFMQATDGTVLRQMTGMDTHVIYAVRYWPVGRVLQVALIEIRDWQPWYLN